MSARHTDISPALRTAAEDKIGRLGRLLGRIERAEVHFYEERNPRIEAKEVCEVRLDGRGHHLHCTAAAVDGFAAIDRAVEKLEHQLQRAKSKQVPRKARRATPAEAGEDLEETA